MLDRLRFGIPMLHPVPDMQPLIDLVWTASAELNHHIKWKTSKEMCRVILHTAIWFWAKIITIRTLYNIMLVITCSCVYFKCMCMNGKSSLCECVPVFWLNKSDTLFSWIFFEWKISNMHKIWHEVSLWNRIPNVPFVMWVRTGGRSRDQLNELSICIKV